jgi:hypothetical protein
MTLNKKLKSEIIAAPVMDEVIEYWTSELEQIADDFAIGFAKWCFEKYNIISCYDMEELLEIYKNEKRL